MDIEHKIPEGKNLMTLSFAIIIYYLGNAELIDKTLHLNFINLKFNNVTSLTLLIWATLFWFLFKYWQVVNGEITKEYEDHLRSIDSIPFIKSYFIKKSNLRATDNNTFLLPIKKPGMENGIFNLKLLKI